MVEGLDVELEINSSFTTYLHEALARNHRNLTQNSSLYQDQTTNKTPIVYNNHSETVQ